MPLVNIEQLRAIQWDKSNLWDIEIDGIQNSAGFIPANDMELGFHGVTDGQYGAASFAQSTTYPVLTLSFMDDEKLSVVNQLRDWMSDIVDTTGLIVAPVNMIKRAIIITKLTSTRTPVPGGTMVLWAYPTGQISYHGDSDGSTPIYSLQFTVVGSDLHSRE